MNSPEINDSLRYGFGLRPLEQGRCRSGRAKMARTSCPFRAEAALAAVPAPKPLLPVLIVLHQETSTPGRVGNALRALGHPLDIRRPRFGDPLAGNAGSACRRGHLRRPDERQRSRRLRSPRDRLDRSPAARAAAVPRHLPGRADARQATGRAGRAASGRPRRRSAITRSARPPRATRSARTGRIRSITGTARDFELPAGAELLAEGDDFPVQAFQSGHAFGFQFHPDVTYAMMHRWTTRGCERHGFAGRAGAPSSLRRSRGA